MKVLSALAIKTVQLLSLVSTSEPEPQSESECPLLFLSPGKTNGTSQVISSSDLSPSPCQGDIQKYRF